jgi:hypothetical protein
MLRKKQNNLHNLLCQGVFDCQLFISAQRIVNGAKQSNVYSIVRI